jgi:hypothetical protein
MLLSAPCDFPIRAPVVINPIVVEREKALHNGINGGAFLVVLSAGDAIKCGLIGRERSFVAVIEQQELQVSPMLREGQIRRVPQVVARIKRKPRAFHRKALIILATCIASRYILDSATNL